MQIFFFPREVLCGPGLEGQGPHPREHLPFPVVPVFVKGYQHLMGRKVDRGEKKDTNFLHRTGPQDKGSLCQKVGFYTFQKHQVGKPNSWPLIHYFWTPPLEHLAPTRVKYLVQQRRHIYLSPWPPGAPLSSVPVAAEDSPWPFQTKLHPEAWQTRLFCFCFLLSPQPRGWVRPVLFNYNVFWKCSFPIVRAVP